MNTCLKNLTVVLIIIFSLPTHAQSNISMTKLEGIDPFNLKGRLNMELMFTNDYISHTGGIQAGPRNINATSLFIKSDLSKFSRVNGEFMFHFVHLNSNDKGGTIGDSQVASNIDIANKGDRLCDAWYQHTWGKKFKTLMGLHDISTEFNLTNSSANFVNSSFGTTTDFALSGTHGPSLFPITSIGLRAEYSLNKQVLIRAGVYDADPGDASTFRSLHSDIGGHEGYMSISEISYENKNQKLGFGGWNYGQEREKLTDETETASSFGTYLIQEQKWGNSFWSFARYGWANPLVNVVQSNLVTGLIYKGLFQFRKKLDEIGAGYSTAHFPGGNNEDVYEIFYQFKALDSVTLRPDIQYIKTPSGLSEIPDAWAYGIRTMIQI